jgi:hypothetical protein
VKIDKLRSIAQRAIDDPLMLWLVVAVLVGEGILLALYVLGVL